MDPLTFLALDNADGSSGRISLADQRREHVQMWTLLGDPALRMPPPAFPIDLNAKGAVAAGAKVSVTGHVPNGCRASTVHLTLERPLASQPIRVGPRERDATDRASKLSGLRRANTADLDVTNAAVQDGEFTAVLKAPDALSWPTVTVRAVAESPEALAQGAIKLPVQK
jgi:hypothetical protein